MLLGSFILASFASVLSLVNVFEFQEIRVRSTCAAWKDISYMDQAPLCCSESKTVYGTGQSVSLGLKPEL